MLGWLRGIHRETWRDAGRLGVQSAVAGTLAVLVATWWGLDRFLVVMMAVTALSASVGGTLGQGLVRIESAAVGTVLGLLAVLLVPAGWGTATAVGVALLIAGTAMTLRASWQLILIPVVGMALAGREQLWDMAGLSAAGIATGAGIGVAVSWLVWPERAEARFERHYRRALRATAARLADAIAATVEAGGSREHRTGGDPWDAAMWLAGEALGQARFVDGAGMARRLQALRDLHGSVTILDRAAERANPPLSVAVMQGQVGRLREHACAVLSAMAEGERARLGPVDADLAGLRAAMEREDPRAPEAEVHAAVAFGLAELRRDLERLVAAQGRPEAAAVPIGEVVRG